MRAWITNLCLIGQAIGFLTHFSLIAVRGQVLIKEPNAIVLGLEIALMVGIIALGICNMVKQVRTRGG